MQIPSASTYHRPPPRLLSDGHSLLLDFDGTLVEIADHPDGIIVDTNLLGLIENLAGTFLGRFALVSGRSVEQLETILGPAIDEIAIVGSHGAETQAGGVLSALSRPSILTEVERVLKEKIGVLEGVVLETKSFGVAAHFRRAPHVEPMIRTAVADIARATGLGVQEGKMMLELRTPGHDKGTGIAALMQHPPFAGTMPIFVGDDVTDEAGFRAVSEIGGIGVLVGPERPTAALYRLADVSAVRAWLGAAS